MGQCLSRRKCASHCARIIKVTRSQDTLHGGGIFLFVLALLLVFSIYLVSNSTAQEIAAASSSPPPAASDPARAELAAAFPRSLDGTVSLVVSISVNTETRGDFFVELDEQGQLFLRRDDVVDVLRLYFAADQTVLIRKEPFIPLGALREVRYSFDEKTLVLVILGKARETRKTAIDMYPLPSRPKDVYYPREQSAFLNYGLNYSQANPGGFQSFSVSNKLGLRAGDVFFISDSLYTKTEKSDKFVRLSSNATYERRDDLQWLVLGDQFANSGDLGSTLNIGGLGFSKVYSLDPYFITQPLFNLGGVTAFPSRAEIYLDGVLVGKHAIAPGPFELKNIYATGGARRLEVLLIDPFGNEERISYPLYFSALLLRQGLHEYGYHAGFLRERYGTESNDYGKPAFSAFHRYGVTSSLNVGVRAEGGDDIYNIGLLSSFLLPRAGSFSVSLAGSAANGQGGMAGSFHHSYQRGSFSANLLLRGFSREYATVGNPLPADPTKYEMNVGAGFLWQPLGSFSLSYSERETYNGSNTRVASASFSRALSRAASLYLTASATRQVDWAYSFFAGLNFNFAKVYRGAAQFSRTDGANTQALQVQKDVPRGEGLTYRASLNRSETGTTTAYSLNPYLQYNARYGIYALDASIRNTAGDTLEAYNLSAAGSLVYAGGFYGLSRPVGDSFGIVIVDKLPQAKVFSNGQEIGETDARGIMVIPTLASYGRNLITLDVKNVPLDYSISGVNRKVSPSLWSGSCISFEALKVQAVTGTLLVNNGDKKTPLEYVDTSLQVGDREIIFPTGKGGEFYLENILPADPAPGAKDDLSCSAIAQRIKSGGNYIPPGRYRGRGDFAGTKCEFFITFPITEEVITELGEVKCVIPQEAKIVRNK